jgi:dTDP-4-amino-4,6-dideoxygalactose transaminase
MTSSCTKALEIIALSLGLEAGDEVIMPSFNFVGVANSFVLAGANIVFADIEPNTMNICPDSIRRAIGPKTKALLVMHYAGIACEMDAIRAICEEYNLMLIEDNAQGIHCKYKGQLLGSFGDYSCISFDTMKNISCGEGGVLLFKEKHQKKIIEIFDVGTNKKAFENGLVGKYEWVCLGSKYALSEYNAAILFPLLSISEEICNLRREKWDYLYNGFLTKPEISNLLPKKSNAGEHKGHVFFIKCKNIEERDLMIKMLKESGIVGAFHFSPLHSSPYALEHKLKIERDIHTTVESDRLLRLPIYSNIEFEELDKILDLFAKK